MSATVFVVVEGNGNWEPVAVYTSAETAKSLAPESNDWRESAGGVSRNWGLGRDLLIYPLPLVRSEQDRPVGQPD